MIGLIFLVLLAVISAFALRIAAHFAAKLAPSNRSIRLALTLLLTASLVALPLADEIVGGFQFRSLCQENSVLKIDAVRIRGKTIRVQSDSLNQEVTNTPIRIYYSRVSYRDVATDEELATVNSYVAEGGWLIRTLGMNTHIPPLIPMTLRNASTCPGPAILKVSRMYGFTYQPENSVTKEMK